MFKQQKKNLIIKALAQYEKNNLIFRPASKEDIMCGISAILISDADKLFDELIESSLVEQIVDSDNRICYQLTESGNTYFKDKRQRVINVTLGWSKEIILTIIGAIAGSIATLLLQQFTK